MIIGNTYTDGSVKWRVANGGGESTRVYSDSPIGTIIPYIVNNDLPEGYLICNGAAVSRTEYKDLFMKIGTDYGNGDGETTFNLPDLRDKFLEGNTTAGINIEAGLPNITGTLNVRPYSQSTYKSIFTGGKTGALSMTTYDYSGSIPSINSTSGITRYDTIKFNAADSKSIYSDSINTVQPPAFTVIYLIRAYYTTDVFDHTHSVASTTENGFMSSEDKNRLDNVITLLNEDHKILQYAGITTSASLFTKLKSFLNYICDSTQPYYSKIWNNNNTKTLIGSLNLNTVYFISGYIFPSSGIYNNSTYGNVPQYCTFSIHSLDRSLYHLYTNEGDIYLYQYSGTQITS